MVFVSDRVKGSPEGDSVWLQVPDGYIRESAMLFGILGPPYLIPFDPVVHLNTSIVSNLCNDVIVCMYHSVEHCMYKAINNLTF